MHQAGHHGDIDKSPHDPIIQSIAVSPITARILITS